MANKWIDRIYNHTDYRGGELAVALKIADAANRETDECTLKIRTIADATRLSERQVKRIIHELESDGTLEIQRFYGRGRAPTFKLKKVTSVTPFKDRPKPAAKPRKGDISNKKKVTSVTAPYIRNNPIKEPVNNLERSVEDQRLILYRKAFLGHELTPFQKEMILYRVTCVDAWKEVLRYWAGNGYKAQSVERMCNKHDEILEQKNHGANTSPRGKRTDEDVKRESEQFIKQKFGIT